MSSSQNVSMALRVTFLECFRSMYLWFWVHVRSSHHSQRGVCLDQLATSLQGSPLADATLAYLLTLHRLPHSTSRIQQVPAKEYCNE